MMMSLRRGFSIVRAFEQTDRHGRNVPDTLVTLADPTKQAERRPTVKPGIEVVHVAPARRTAAGRSPLGRISVANTGG